MLSTQHPLFDLQSLAALQSADAELVVYPDDDETAEELVEQLEEELSRELPQAELVESERLELRLRLPHLVLEDWLPASHLLASEDLPFALRIAAPTPWREALDQGRLGCDLLEARGLRATSWTDRVDEVPLSEELEYHRPTHPLVAGLLSEITAASDAALGVGVLDPARCRVVARRRDGRVGLDLIWTRTEPSVRHAAMAVIADLVFARMGHRDLRLAPDLSWDPGPPLRTRIWFLLVHLTPLPRGSVLGAPLSPGPLADGELLVLPQPVPSSMRELQAARPRAEAAAPMWLHLDQPTFAPTWRDAVGGPVPSDALQLPGPPRGLEAMWPELQAHPHRGSRRWLVRYRHGLRDRDLIEQTTPRDTEPRDALAASALHEAALAAELEAFADDDRWICPVRDDLGTPGLQLSLDGRDIRGELAYRRAMDALSEVDAGLGPLATVAFAGRQLLIQLWYDVVPEPGHRRWTIPASRYPD